MDFGSGLWLALLAFAAALINGAVGYGFSSIITPIAILWYSNKVLNPALVIVELGVNMTLLTRERKFVAATWPRARPVISTLLPGVLLGTAGLTYLAVNDVKLVVYLVLLPLTILQLVGFVHPFKNENRGGAAVGPGIGFLYALTTISGPPLALFLRNQGMSKNEFRCAISQIRVAESSLTLGTYLAFSTFLGANLFTLPAISLIPFLLVPVVIAVPLGTLLLQSFSPEYFRRFVMAVDGLIVSYGLTRVLNAINWLNTEASYILLGALLAFVVTLAYMTLRRISRADAQASAPVAPPNPGALEEGGSGSTTSTVSNETS
jgi:uncharacterized protein